MRILLLLDSTRDGEPLTRLARATGAEIHEAASVEAAVRATREGEVDAILAGAGEIARLSGGSEQIGDELRNAIMGPVASIVGYGQLLEASLHQVTDEDRKRVAAITEHGRRIREHLYAQPPDITVHRDLPARLLRLRDRDHPDGDARRGEIARATGAEIVEGHDVESAVRASWAGEVIGVIAGSEEISRLCRGSEEISSWLRHQIMNPLATVLGYAQLLELRAGPWAEADREKLRAIAEKALLIRDLVNGTRQPEDRSEKPRVGTE